MKNIQNATVKKKNLIKKWTKDLLGHFTKETIDGILTCETKFNITSH